MSDQSDIDMDTGDAGVDESSSKRGPGFLVSLLKWIAIALGAVIFIFTIVVITLKVMGLTGRSQTPLPVSEDYVPMQEPLEWYQSLSIQPGIRTSDVPPASVTVSIALGYTIGDKEAPAELSSRSIELGDSLRYFFSRKTAAELRNEAAVKVEIRNFINDNVLTKARIRDVRFTQYTIIEQVGF